MTHQSSTAHVPGAAGAGRQVAQLRHVLGLIEQIAGRETPPRELALDEDARISSAYEAAVPIVQRRFDALAGEIAAWAAAGAQALLSAQNPTEPPRAAAAGLADELLSGLRRLGRTIRS